MARPKIKGRVMDPRRTGYGIIQPGAGEGRDYGQELIDEVKGRLGGKHTPGVEESFKRRGKRAFEKMKGY